MIQIRNNVFETNSSSTHALALAKETDYKNHPNVIYFEQGDFSWEDEEVSPANYLYTYILTQVEGWYDEKVAINDILNSYYIKRIDELLNEFGIECIFDGYSIENNNYSDSEYIKITGYIDHQSQDMLAVIFNDLMSDKNLLYRYLFASHVYTGNDNEGNYLGEPLRKCLCGHETVECWKRNSWDRIEEVKNPNYDPKHFDYYE